ncbi:MAG: carbohydrate kinase family protein, partial [Saprospiraceae bacterium]|nr:carbohydrate kinase family protein [Saprospiraceae bacterium]
IWPDREQAQTVVATYCANGALVKVSEVDWERLYGNPLKDPYEAANHFLALGAKEVCVTLGGEGCLAATTKEQLFLPARPVQVKDTTGAGDAFWSGYLTAWLDGRNLENCAKAGRRMAEIKLGYFGSLPKMVERESIYTE